MKILVNWDYERADLMKAFTSLKGDIHFVFIYRNVRVAETEKIFGTEILYWDDFNSPYELLRKVQPDKILFHDIESFIQVSLNIAARNKGIPTLVLEHGLRGAYEIDIALNSFSAKDTSAGSEIIAEKKAKSSIRFYLRSFRSKNIVSLFYFLLFPFIRRKYGLALGLYKCRFDLRTADLYINFTDHNASYIMKRDGVNIHKIISIGNPCFDELFKYLEKGPYKPGDYYLLIDAPYCEQSIFNMKKEAKAAFYKKLNAFCLFHNARLKIKLHPHSYEADYLPEHSNIEYLRECNIAELLGHTRGCFLLNLSTLSPLALYYSKCLYFNTGINPYDKELIESSFVPACNFNSFEPDELKFRESTIREKEVIKKDYLYATDGKATERLKQILLR
jgi:hypothetical protein